MFILEKRQTVLGTCIVVVLVLLWYNMGWLTPLAYVYKYSEIQTITSPDITPSVQGSEEENPEDQSLETLTRILKRRLQEKTDSPKIEYTSPCGKIFKGCTDQTCKRPLSSDPEQRLKEIITSPKLTLSASERDLILSIGRDIPENDVIFVSASSSNHYNEMQAMFYNLHTVVYPNITNFSMVFFDLGLTADQRQATEKNCKCQVLTFPKQRFPEHVSNLYCYSWKPLIVFAAMSKARRLVVWQDASIRWQHDPQELLDRAEKFGFQYIRYDGSDSISVNTIKQTFDYFEDEPCAYLPYPELQASFSIHKKDSLVIRAVLEPWARCALEPNCVCPASPVSVISCYSESRMHRCHRFDQSALSIITAKLYAQDMYRILTLEREYGKPNYINIRREHVMTYFRN